MIEKPQIGKQSDFIIDSMSCSNRDTKEYKMTKTNKQHMQDLQFRLDMVAGNVQAKRQAKLDARSRDNQFKGYRSLTTGQSESYLKNGTYLPK